MFVCVFTFVQLTICKKQRKFLCLDKALSFLFLLLSSSSYNQDNVRLREHTFIQLSKLVSLHNLLCRFSFFCRLINVGFSFTWQLAAICHCWFSMLLVAFFVFFLLYFSLVNYILLNYIYITLSTKTKSRLFGDYCLFSVIDCCFINSKFIANRCYSCIIYEESKWNIQSRRN